MTEEEQACFELSIRLMKQELTRRESRRHWASAKCAEHSKALREMRKRLREEIDGHIRLFGQVEEAERTGVIPEGWRTGEAK